jgi:eukaryotic-like serine/threonine-protein kinase
MARIESSQGFAGSEHPPVEQLHAFAVGQLGEDDSREVERHLAVCTLCSQALETSPDDTFVALVQQGDSLVRSGASPAAGPSGSLHSVPGYTLMELLGEGGMGVVWKARHDGLNRLVALKRLRFAGPANAEALARFRREAESVARLQHGNIVQIYDIGEHEGEPYLALEYVGGGSLAQRLAAGPLPPKPAAALVEMLARAMHYAHERGIIHRDLKPGNILLASGGCESSIPSPTGGLDPPLADLVPKISDFGLAKQLDAAKAHTQTGAILGTPSYMAPEQASGGQTAIGPAVDVYALGAILYETLTGRPPFRGPTVLDTLVQVREQEPVSPRQLQPSVRRDLETICLKCLHKEPQRRYTSAWGLAEDLRSFCAGEPIRARPVGRLERFLKWTQRQPSMAILVFVALLAPLAIVTGLLWHNHQLKKEIRRADDARNRAETAESAEREHYAKARKTIFNIYHRIGDWQHFGMRSNDDWGRDIRQYGLEYVETVLATTVKDDPRAQADAAELLMTIAKSQVQAGQRKEAQTSFLRAKDLWDKLIAEHPDDLELLGAITECYRTAPHFFDCDPRQRVTWLEKALVFIEKQSGLKPSDDCQLPLALGLVHHEMAAHLQADSRSGEAEEHYNRAIDIWTKVLTKYPKTTGCKIGMGLSHTNLGSIYFQTGRTQMAEKAFQRGDALYEEAMREGYDPSDLLLYRMTLIVNWGISYLLGKQPVGKQPEKALDMFNRGLKWKGELLRLRPNYAGIQQAIASLHGSRAQAYDEMKRYPEAAEEWKHALEFDDGTHKVEFQLGRCVSLARSGDSVHAAAEAEKIAAASKLPSQDLYNCACVLALSGQGEKAIAILEKLRQSGYFDEAERLNDLRTDEDLNSLRRRDDFVKLLNVAAKPAKLSQNP